MKILYLGYLEPHTTSRHRGDALGRLGHAVTIESPFAFVRADLRHPFWGRVHFRTGYQLLQPKLRKWVRALRERHPQPDVVWVEGGELLGAECVRLLREWKAPVVFFNVDDPTGNRDGRRFDRVKEALPFYDLGVAVRPETAAEMRALGVPRALRVIRSYDEIMHAPFADAADIPPDFRSEVAFIGTWMRHEGRDTFLRELIDRGIPVSIWGERWQKSPQWSRLQGVWKGPPLGGREYVAAIQGSKLCLGMLSKGNRDLHTTRSLEIPYAGGLLCAERTSEHREMYRENEEAVFWADAAECAAVCRRLLDDAPLRERIRLAGMRRVRALGVGNEDIGRQVLAALFEGRP